MERKTVVLTFDDAVSNHASFVAPLLVEQIFDIIRELHAAGTTTAPMCVLLPICTSSISSVWAARALRNTAGPIPSARSVPRSEIEPAGFTSSQRSRTART